MYHPEGVCSGPIGALLDQHGRRPSAVPIYDPDTTGDQRLCRHQGIMNSPPIVAHDISQTLFLHTRL